MLKFPILVQRTNIRNQDALERKALVVKCIIWLTNGFFYGLSFGYLLYAYLDNDLYSNALKHVAYDLCLKAASAVLLVFSMGKFSRNMNSVKAKDLKQSEGLMIVHVTIFMIYIVAYLCLITCLIITLNTDNRTGQQYVSKTYCRAYIGFNVFHLVMLFTSIVMLILFIFLSVKFSEPLKDYQDTLYEHI